MASGPVVRQALIVLLVQFQDLGASLCRALLYNHPKLALALSGRSLSSHQSRQSRPP